MRVDIAFAGGFFDVHASDRVDDAACRLEDPCSAAFSDEFTGHATERCPGGDGFPVPELSARTQWSAALDSDMADLGAEAVRPAV